MYYIYIYMYPYIYIIYIYICLWKINTFHILYTKTCAGQVTQSGSHPNLVLIQYWIFKDESLDQRKILQDFPVVKWREQHRNMYIIKCETDRQSRWDAWDKCLGLVYWDDPKGLDGGSGWGTHVNPWLITVIVGQKPLQYCKVISLQLIKLKEKN